jgi:hypothetical protein
VVSQHLHHQVAAVAQDYQPQVYLVVLVAVQQVINMLAEVLHLHLAVLETQGLIHQQKVMQVVLGH